MVIWKYVMEFPSVAFDMPEGAEVLSCQMQSGCVCIWALVNPEAKTEKRRFKTIETGERVYIPRKKLKFLNTVQNIGTKKVHHIFEIIS